MVDRPAAAVGVLEDRVLGWLGPWWLIDTGRGPKIRRRELRSDPRVNWTPDKWLSHANLDRARNGHRRENEKKDESQVERQNKGVEAV